ncbi:hypothetical protein TPHA_0A05360 [Tetrapisispora phaffii CBS 4417]|uniref:Mitochondrial carrier protein MTM1 n=1 Tax=Tetrapisispora phaffii (strain ATCC 24235 / CBS 4417 / NBRC 1672 / NRRL Y-8282 / UCD 70-5) TaxID=1071381 RepID=G8BNY2_TETPH|nr:hypothetical protein TPHA_0A05360 [Tetrapisispora phaffii CBS 4417]CCE61610.1 hypothetical protein TPHA_0A05360 [Tetrapisispora phaffii CBS 4417]
MTESLTLTERMTSAMTGSLITSMILTPMDVVRVRLQQQELLPDCSCDFANTNSNSITKNSIKSSGLKQFSPHPLTTTPGGNILFWQTSCFKDMNCKNSVIRYSGTIEALKKIAQLEGISTLWRGLSITLFMAIPSNIIYFTGYEYMRDLSPLSQTLPSANPIFCGAFARIIAATTIAPLELIKTRLQSIPTSNSMGNTKLLRDVIRESRIEIQSEGLKAIFKGLQITLWRDVPFSAIYWGSYEYCKKNLTLFHKENSFISNGASHFLNSFIHGSISGFIAALCTHPFDVGKTRLQISLKNSNDKKELSRSMFVYLNNIRKVEGFKTLFAGLIPRVAKIAPSCAIMISTYEFSKRYFLH